MEPVEFTSTPLIDNQQTIKIKKGDAYENTKIEAAVIPAAVCLYGRLPDAGDSVGG